MLEFGYYNMDCMIGMKEFPDKYFDLAVVDPPYGIPTLSSATTRIRKYGQLKTVNDAKPKPEYFKELFRVSQNQIIFGYNHLSDMLPTTKEFIFWYKHQPVSTYSDGELAWTSFDKTAKVFDYPYFGGVGSEKGRFHPTQKPTCLYRWIFKTYTKAGMKLLDTHVGSASSLIAAYDAGLQYVGFEIDKDYYNKSNKRLEIHKSQVNIFDLGIERR